MSSHATAVVGDHRLPASHVLRAAQPVAIALGLMGMAGAVYGWRHDQEAFFRSYLVVYLFWLGFPLGAAGILGLQYVTGGRWGVALRRILEATAQTLPLVAVLFTPIVFGMPALYEWTHAEVLAADELLRNKAVYLNETFFQARAGVYFFVWLILAFLLCRWSRMQDKAAEGALERRLQFLGRSTLVLYGLTMTFASVDWAMSVEPHWFSHIYGVRMIGGQILGAFAFSTVVLTVLAVRGPLAAYISPMRFHDLGNLLLAFVMLWAYFELSQFLIIWSGDLPEEATFYLARTGQGWGTYAVVLVLLHFVMPFVVLLSRPVKRNPGRLACVAGALVFMRLADLYWQIAPGFDGAEIVPPWVFGALVFAMGGPWFALFVRNLAAHPLLPVTDTSLLREED